MRQTRTAWTDNTGIDEALARSHAVAPLREAAALVRGRHYTEWVPTLDELRSDSERQDEYLALLLEIIDATERETLYSGLEPPPGYYTRAAIVYRKRRDIDAEIAVLERWMRICPPDRRNGKIADRLAKAVAIKNKTS